MDQDYVRKRVEAAKAQGVNYAFIAEQAGVSRQHFSHFMGGRNFTPENLMKVIRWLQANNHWQDQAEGQHMYALIAARWRAGADFLDCPTVSVSEKTQVLAWEYGVLRDIIMEAVRVSEDGGESGGV